MSARRFSWRLAWLLALCTAPVILVALMQDTGAHAYDAATEHILRGVAFSDVISDGVLYPRWTSLLHWGLGSPLFHLPAATAVLWHGPAVPDRPATPAGLARARRLGLRPGVPGRVPAGVRRSAGSAGPACWRASLISTRHMSSVTRSSAARTKRTACSSTRLCCGASSLLHAGQVGVVFFLQRWSGRRASRRTFWPR